MIFYLTTLAYFFFIVETISKPNHRSYVFIAFLILLTPLVPSLYAQKYYFTLSANLLCTAFALLHLSLKYKNKYFHLPLILIINAFYFIEVSHFPYRHILSYFFIFLAIIITSNDIKTWGYILIASTLIVLPTAFSPEKTIPFMAYDYHILFIPGLIHATALIFAGWLIPFLISNKHWTNSFSSNSTRIFLPFLTLLHISQFFPSFLTSNKAFIHINAILIERFHIILASIIIFPLAQLLKHIALEIKIYSLNLIYLTFLFIVAAQTHNSNYFSKFSIIPGFFAYAMITILIPLLKHKTISQRIKKILIVHISFFLLLYPIILILKLPKINTPLLYHIPLILWYAYYCITLLNFAIFKPNSESC